MKKSVFHKVMLGVWALVFMFPAIASAKAIIEFTDGHRMKVSSYKEEGHKVTVYTTRGSFAFQRSEVAKIIDLDVEEKMPHLPPSQKAQAASQKQEAAAVTIPRAETALAKKNPNPSKEETAVRNLKKNIQEVQIFEFLSDGMFRLRYAFALLLFVKGLKLFFAASIR